MQIAWIIWRKRDCEYLSVRITFVLQRHIRQAMIKNTYYCLLSCRRQGTQGHTQLQYIFQHGLCHIFSSEGLIFKWNRPIYQQGCHYGFLKYFSFIKYDVDIWISRRNISLTCEITTLHEK